MIDREDAENFRLANLCLCGQPKYACCCEVEFDADELGLDPETDNTPEDPSRHA